MLTAAAAGIVLLGLHLHTLHIGSESGTPPALRSRDDTPGMFVRLPEHQVLNGEPTFGIYRNSLGRTTVYGGLTWQTESKRFAASLALASGYRIKRVTGPHACLPDAHTTPRQWCYFDQGGTHAKLMPIGALSVAFPEAKPYLLGATPRVLWVGKGLSLAIEQEF